LPGDERREGRVERLKERRTGGEFEERKGPERSPIRTEILDERDTTLPSPYDPKKSIMLSIVIRNSVVRRVPITAINGRPWFLERWFCRSVPRSVPPFGSRGLAELLTVHLHQEEKVHIETLRTNARGASGNLSNGRVGMKILRSEDNGPCEQYNAVVVRSCCVGHAHDFDGYPWLPGVLHMYPEIC